LAAHFFPEVFGQVKHERWHHVLPGIRISNGCTDSSPEQTVQLTEQIHLSRLWWVDVEDWGGWGCGFGGGWLGVPVKKFSQLFEILTKRFEHAALVQGGGWMQQGEEDKVFQVEGLAAHLSNSHLSFQQRLCRPIS
jgi:hypothetical protein